MEKKYLHNIAYTECGSGEPLVLLHGYLCSSSVFEQLIEPLSEKYRLIVPDLPGHGESLAIDKGDHVDDFANALIPFLNAVCPGKMNLYGHSMGAYIALSIAVRIPKRISRLGLINASAHAPSTKRVKLKDREKKFILRGKLELILRNSIPYSFKPENRKPNTLIINNLVYEALNIDPQIIVNTIDAIVTRPGRINFMKESGIKIDYLVGAFDSVNDLLLMKSEVAEIKTAEIKVFYDSGHFCFIEEQDEFVKYLNSKGQR